MAQGFLQDCTRPQQSWSARRGNEANTATVARLVPNQRLGDCFLGLHSSFVALLNRRRKSPAGSRTSAWTTGSTIIFASNLAAVNWLCRYRVIQHAVLATVATFAKSRRAATRHWGRSRKPIVIRAVPRSSSQDQFVLRLGNAPPLCDPACQAPPPSSISCCRRRGSARSRPHEPHLGPMGLNFHT